MKNKNPWSPSDEKEHLGSKIEWWASEAFFTSTENNKKWSFKGNLVELNQKPYLGSIIHSMLYNLDKSKHYSYDSTNWSDKLKSEKNRFEVWYEDSFMKGLYPNYEMKFIDHKHRVEIYLNYKAKSLPHWVAQDIADGWLPQGLSFHRYGFIPDCDISGKLKIKNRSYTIKGKGYLEHVWGDFLYRNPLYMPKNMVKSISIYAKLLAWWLISMGLARL